MSSSPEVSEPGPVTDLIAREPTADELPALRRARAASFGMPVTRPIPELKEVLDRLVPINREIAVVDRKTEQVLGGCKAFAFDLSVPGGAAIPVAGLSAVGLDPTKTGRGGLRSMMAKHFEQSLDHGDVASVLMASESGIYGRYGYGAATEVCEWRTNTASVSLRDDAPVADGSIELVTDLDEAATLLKSIYDENLPNRPGGLSRSADWWELILRSPKKHWSGGGDQFVGIRRDASGKPDGYALWTIEHGAADTSSEHGRCSDIVQVRELVGCSPEAETQLFMFLQAIPLSTQMVWEFAPVDPIVRFHLQDPRQLWQHARLDMLWIRPLDIPALLQARSWSGSGELVLDVTDQFVPELGGRFRLHIENGEAAVEATSDDADLRCTAATLGAMYLGGTTPGAFYRAGHIAGGEGAIQMFDHLMLSTHEPFTLTKF